MDMLILLNNWFSWFSRVKVAQNYLFQGGFILLLSSCVYFIVSCNNIEIEQNEPFIGNPGGHEGPPATAGPPMDPESWHKVPGDVLGEGEFWGYRVNARTTFKIPGGLGLLYSSHAGPTTSEWRANQIEQGLTTGPSGSLAYTHDLITWHDYPGNPVLNEVKRSWQTPARVHTRDMFYDPKNNRWVAYYSNIPDHDRPETSFPGIRVAGLAYSKDLVNWDYSDGPILTIEDYAAMVPERIEATEEELNEYGRLYPNWAMYHNGRYYLVISGTETVGRRAEDALEDAGVVRSLSTGLVVVVGDSPEGPFEHLDVAEDEIMPGAKPVYWNGRWYTVFRGTWDDQPGFGLAWSDELFGTYRRNPDNPIITIDDNQRTNPILFHYDGTWGILFSRAGQASVGRMQPLRLAIANINPSFLMLDKEVGEKAGLKK